jgi:hypothetical protein
MSRCLAACRQAVARRRDKPSKSVEEVNQEQVDCVRTLALDPVPCTLQDVAAAQSGQGLAEVLDLRLRARASRNARTWSADGSMNGSKLAGGKVMGVGRF